jgi:hypothetical protein
VQGELVVDGVVASPFALTSALLNAVPPEMYQYLPAIFEAAMAPLYQLYLQVCRLPRLPRPGKQPPG